MYTHLYLHIHIYIAARCNGGGWRRGHEPVLRHAPKQKKGLHIYTKTCMYICIYIYIYTYRYVYTYIYTRTYIYIAVRGGRGGWRRGHEPVLRNAPKQRKG